GTSRLNANSAHAWRSAPAIPGRSVITGYYASIQTRFQLRFARTRVGARPGERRLLVKRFLKTRNSYQWERGQIHMCQMVSSGSSKATAVTTHCNWKSSAVGAVASSSAEIIRGRKTWT